MPESTPATPAVNADSSAERCRVRVALAAFEGTLDSLITLVRKDETMLMHLELRQMTAQLLSQAETLDIQDAGIAVLLSAQIVALKAAALRRFAGDSDAPDEERETDDEILTLLLECKDLVKELRDEDGGRVTHGSGWVEPTAQRPSHEATTAKKERGAEEFSLDDLDQELGQLQREVSGANVLRPERYPRAHVLAELERRLEGRTTLGFGEFDDEVTGFRIALFLALLEEVRSRRLALSQSAPHDEILIRRP